MLIIWFVGEFMVGGLVVITEVGCCWGFRVMDVGE